MAKLITVPGGGNGDVRYTLAPGEAFSLDSVVFGFSPPFGSGNVVPTLIVRDQSGALIARVTAPTIFA